MGLGLPKLTFKKLKLLILNPLKCSNFGSYLVAGYRDWTEELSEDYPPVEFQLEHPGSLSRGGHKAPIPYLK